MYIFILAASVNLPVIVIGLILIAVSAAVILILLITGASCLARNGLLLLLW